MTLSAYFMSKSVFDVQGCPALTLALARLSCLKWSHQPEEEQQDELRYEISS